MSNSEVTDDRAVSTSVSNPGAGVILKWPGGRIVVIRHGAVHILTDRATFDQLPRGFWLSNLPWHSARSLCDKDGFRHVHEDGWIGITTADMLEEWGCQIRQDQKVAQELGRCQSRVVRLADSIAAQVGDWQAAKNSPASETVSLLSGTSLTSGLGREIYRQMKTPRTDRVKMLDMQNELKSVGVIGLRSTTYLPGSRGHAAMAYPAVAYLERLASQPVPRSGLWRRQASEDVGKEINDKILDRMASTGHPIVLRGKFESNDLMLQPWLNSWLSGQCRLFGRRSFIVDEIRILKQFGRFRLDEVVQGPGWTSPGGHAVLADCSELLASFCGGRLLALNSWSAGVVASAIVRAALCFPLKPRRQIMQTAWLAAYDRIAMLPALQVLDKLDITLVSAVGGRIEYVAPDCASTRARLASRMWSLGIVTTSDVASERWGQMNGEHRRFRDYGGPADAAPKVVAARCGRPELLWSLDRLLDSGRDRREDNPRNVLARLVSEHA